MSYKLGGKWECANPIRVLLKNKKKKRSRLGNGENRMANPYSKLRTILTARKRIKELETLFAKEIQAVADLLKENQRIEKELEETKKQRDCWRNLYRKIRPDEKVPCNRQEAMVVHGELDVSEVLHGSFDK